MVGGRLQIKDRAREYIDRGDLLENWSFLDFFLNTYDGSPLEDVQHSRGRKANTRVAYRDGTKRDRRCQIIKSTGHDTIPYFPGQWFPKQDLSDCNGLFEASMLALFKPWRSLTDLKQPDENFRTAYNSFLQSASADSLRIIKNTQFYHECSEHAARHGPIEEQLDEDSANSRWIGMEDCADGPLEDNDVSETCFDHLVTEEDIVRVIDNPYSPRKTLFAETAVDIGFRCGLLHVGEDNVTYPSIAPLASSDDVKRFKEWQAVLDNAQQRSEDIDVVDENVTGGEYNVDPAAFSMSLHEAENEKGDEELNERQSIAHQIVINHLRDHLAQKNPPQRLMIVHGEGGTGKTSLLNAIAKTFDALQSSHLLAKTATSGVAASIIGGQTLHSWAALPITTPRSDKWITHPSREINARRKNNMGDILWLTIDEMSMLTTPLLLYLSRASGMVRTGIASVEPSLLFGGMSVLLMGDLHQLPPVASTRALYHLHPVEEDNRLGRSYFEQFDTVIKLEQQNRIQDPVWNAILHRSRTGDCTAEDIKTINKLVLTHTDCDTPDFSLPPWSNAILVTSRNGVRTAWNDVKLKQLSRKTKEITYLVYANDQCEGRPLTNSQRLAVAHLKQDDTKKLPHKIEIVKGMQAMVLQNISTDSDLANGTRGIVDDIILDPREGHHAPCSTVRLQYPPAAILFRPLTGRGHSFPGLAKGIVPIFPIRTRFRIGSRTGALVDREQFALTPAYTFTDFKSQGQTIEHVIVDLAKPPSGKLNGFHSYVALSRSRGQKTIRLLRDFDEKLFTTHPNEDLRKEDARLHSLTEETLSRFRSGEFNIADTEM